MASRAPKRSSVATPLVQRIYMLLAQHPGGMTVSQLHDALRDGWTDIDAYRAYQRRLQRRRATSAAGRGPTDGIPWTEEFREHAQQWWVGYRLHGMLKNGTVWREGEGRNARWYAADRGPRAMVPCPFHGYHLTSLDAAATLAQARADEEERARRKDVKRQLREGLTDHGMSTDALRALVQVAYDYISALPEKPLPYANPITQQPSGCGTTA